MPRMIDTDALIEELLRLPVVSDDLLGLGFKTAIDCAITKAANAPTIDAKPVRHGRWVDRYGNKYDNHLYECSECKGEARYRFTRDELGKEIAEQALDDYCPHCGVKMDGNT